MIQPKYSFGRLASVVAAILVPIALSSGPARADGEPARVRGTVASLEGTKLVVHDKDGKDVAITLADKFGAIAVVKASMADISVRLRNGAPRFRRSSPASAAFCSVTPW